MGMPIVEVIFFFPFGRVFVSRWRIGSKGAQMKVPVSKGGAENEEVASKVYCRTGFR